MPPRTCPRLVSSARRAALLAASLALTACGIMGPPASPTGDPAQPAPTLQAVADFYWPYAAMAAHIYTSGGEMDRDMAVAMSSSWLSRHLARADPAAVTELARLKAQRAEILFATTLERHCRQRGDLRACIALAGEEARRAAEREAAADEPIRMSDQVPKQAADCNLKPAPDGPMVPLGELQTLGWEPAPELHRVAATRGWRLFVPELAIDVWRRQLPDEGDHSAFEYALVFRGTVGGGGWVSNLRALTSALPFVWDQYLQSVKATELIQSQVERLHAIADALLHRQPSRIYYTAVGHSLGGGLAQYVQLSVRGISKAVVLDASPVNGSSTIAIDAPAVRTDRAPPIWRAQVAANVREGAHAEFFDPGANVFMLYEDGSVMGRLSGCAPGPLWGAEGGPVRRCDSIDLSKGSVFRQHDIAQMACRLYLNAQRGEPGARGGATAALNRP